MMTARSGCAGEAALSARRIPPCVCLRLPHYLHDPPSCIKSCAVTRDILYPVTSHITCFHITCPTFQYRRLRSEEVPPRAQDGGVTDEKAEATAPAPETTCDARTEAWDKDGRGCGDGFLIQVVPNVSEHARRRLGWLLNGGAAHALRRCRVPPPLLYAACFHLYCTTIACKALVRHAPIEWRFGGVTSHGRGCHCGRGGTQGKMRRDRRP